MLTKFYWTWNVTIRSYKSIGILIFFQNWQLRIQSVSMDDSGDYMCQVFFLHKKIMSVFDMCILLYCMLFRNIWHLLKKITPFPSICTLLNDIALKWAYLIFVISFTQTGFSKTKFYTQKKRLKAPRTLKMSLKKSNIYIFRCASIS